MAKANGAAFKIEKGVPVPDVRPFGSGRTAYPLETMKIGDSFLIRCPPGKCPTRQTNVMNAASHLKRWRAACKDWRFSTRTVKGGVRVWRIQ